MYVCIRRPRLTDSRSSTDKSSYQTGIAEKYLHTWKIMTCTRYVTRESQRWNRNCVWHRVLQIRVCPEPTTQRRECKSFLQRALDHPNSGIAKQLSYLPTPASQTKEAKPELPANPEKSNQGYENRGTCQARLVKQRKQKLRYLLVCPI